MRTATSVGDATHWGQATRSPFGHGAGTGSDCAGDQLAGLTGDQDRQPHWKKQIQLRTRELAQAEQELLTARLSEQTEALRDRRRIVARLKSKITEAEDGLRRVQKWLRNFDREVEPRARAMHTLRQILDADQVKAVALLTETIRVLAEYAEVAQGPPRGANATATANPGTPVQSGTTVDRNAGGAS